MRLPSLTWPLAAALACAALALPAPASARVIELGVTEDRPKASCPDDCQAIGRVSGYPLRVGSLRNPFRVNRRGKVVAFTVTLGKPNAEQVEFFDDLFGGPPQVQLSILRRGTRLRHRLTGQSEPFEVARYYGSSPTFALSRPLTVKKGYIVALTTRNWLPAFAVNQPESDVWRSSRDRERCEDVRQTAAQTTRGSLRTYGCNYRTARLLYTATFVPDPRPTTRER